MNLVSNCGRNGNCETAKSKQPTERWSRHAKRVFPAWLCAALAGPFAAVTSHATEVGNCPPGDARTKELEVRKVVVDLSAAMNSKDGDAFLRLFSKDAVALTRLSDGPMSDKPLHVKGHDMLRALNDAFIRSSPRLEAKDVVTDVGISTSGDLAYVVGDYETRFDAKDGRRMVQRGRYLLVLVSEECQWKIAAQASMAAVVKPLNELRE